MRQHMLAVSAAAVALVVVAGSVPASARDETTISVDTTADVVDFGGAQMVDDLPGTDGQTSLREATIAATNTAGPETIAFDISTTDSGFDGTGFTIHTAAGMAELTLGDDGTTVDATTQPGGFSITIEGPGVSVEPLRGLVIDSSGNAVRGLGVRNYSNGIQVDSGDGNRIVGATLTGNLNGVSFTQSERGAGGDISDSTLRDNRIGIAIVFTPDVVVDGNTIDDNTTGVFVNSSDRVSVTDNVISGSEFAAFRHLGGVGGTIASNTIIDNAIWGIMVQGGQSSQQLTITRNAITGNGALGIDLLGGKEDPAGSPGGGVTRNDPKDTDDGANGLLNYPEMLRAVDDGTVTTVEGRITSGDPQSMTVELFASTAPDPSGFGEGETFVGTAISDAKGRFTATLSGGLAGQWLTATSTDTLGNTSEFSEAVQVAGPRH